MSLETSLGHYNQLMAAATAAAEADGSAVPTKRTSSSTRLADDLPHITVFNSFLSYMIKNGRGGGTKEATAAVPDERYFALIWQRYSFLILTQVHVRFSIPVSLLHCDLRRSWTVPRLASFDGMPVGSVDRPR